MKNGPTFYKRQIDQYLATCILTAKTVSFKEETIAVTKTEYELLRYFVINKNRVLSRQSISEHLWGDHYDMADNYDTVYVHTMNLRKKLAVHPRSITLRRYTESYMPMHTWLKPCLATFYRMHCATRQNREVLISF